MRRSVLTSISTSLLAVVAARAGENPPDPAQVTALELEAALVRRPVVYLVLDPERRTLEVKARGAVLDTIHLRGIELVTQQPLLGRHAPALPPLPAAWTVNNGPGDWDREIVQPTELRPAPKEDEEASDTTAGQDTPSAPTATATPAHETSSSYRAALSVGWDLWVTESLPPQGRWGLFSAAVHDGLARAQGKGQDLPPAVTLAMAGEDAQRLHHLMRSGMAILVTATP
jgi:hypothetical protein